MKKISQEDRSNRRCGIFPFFYCFSFVSSENGMVQVSVSWKFYLDRETGLRHYHSLKSTGS